MASCRGLKCCPCGSLAIGGSKRFLVVVATYALDRVPITICRRLARCRVASLQESSTGEIFTVDELMNGISNVIPERGELALKISGAQISVDAVTQRMVSIELTSNTCASQAQQI